MFVNRIINKLCSGDPFKRDPLQNEPSDVIRWWERRRLFFNFCVGVAGVVTCCAMVACAVIAEPLVGEAIGLPDPPIFAIFGVIAFGIAANICYTGGWITEVLLSKFRLREDTATFGLRAFGFGVKFSIFVTLLPAFLSWIVFVIALISGQKHAPTSE